MSTENSNGQLFGIVNSNRSGKDLWGKNQFNSTFPLSLACYMREQKIPVIYLTLDNELNVVPVELSVDDLFSSSLPSNDLFYSFESQFNPYKDITYDTIERVDLVIAENALNPKGKSCDGKHLRALEVKLTVIPDNSTCHLKEELWAPEIVIRPATTMYCALGTAVSCKEHRDEIRDIFEPICNNIKSWGNETESSLLLPNLLSGLDKFQKQFHEKQTPTIMQPIWKTQGKTPFLHENAFDLFVWSDFALARLFINLAKNSSGNNKISRHARSALRLGRFLFEYSRSGKAHLHNIYSEMTYSYQSDKEFSVSGRVTQKYMDHYRLRNPILSKDIIKKIILNGGEKNLSPERRFDQSVYFSSGY
ncbi:HindVP family restriction endonuclease [Citrobacter portucalensis]|uniref:HindVP family restriction endonuclease n=1 Tax=Citrobacter portucalensis TaxID=1639133 RepID=UPI00226B39BD|nr:HindVP family restriction endonuclease [Citrobacter portucalensis]MCX9006749.1 HindVP family restriction endonuclease [Citrobacter portucalensis]